MRSAVLLYLSRKNKKMKSCNIVLMFAAYTLSCAYSLPLELKNNTIESILETFGYPINPEELGTDFQGDIVASEKEIMRLKSGVTNQLQKWPQGVLVYSVSNRFTHEQTSIIGKAMNMISSQTCIRFRQKQSSDMNYVKFQPHKTACNSKIGMQRGGSQDINLADWCFTNKGGYGGTIAHEIIHALGWAHEHTRKDRDEFVKVDFTNIIEDKKRNYKIFEGSSAYNVGYDFGSIMHYGLIGAFAVDKTKNIITPKRYNYKGEIGQRMKLSILDARKINNMYRGVCVKATGNF